MPNYLFIFHGGDKPSSPEEGAKTMEKWMTWFGAMGDSVVEKGNPLVTSCTVAKSGVTDGGGVNPASGFTVVCADDMDGAVALANGCPLVSDGDGTVEVAECMSMEMG